MPVGLFFWADECGPAAGCPGLLRPRFRESWDRSRQHAGEGLSSTAVRVLVSMEPLAIGEIGIS